MLLLVLLPSMRALAGDESLMGDHRLGRAGIVTTGIVLALIAASVVALGLLTALG